jgi:hypothetical protein
LNDDEDVDKTSKIIEWNNQTSAKESPVLQELKQNKPWCDEECLGILDQRKQAKCSGYRIQAKAMQIFRKM